MRQRQRKEGSCFAAEARLKRRGTTPGESTRQRLSHRNAVYRGELMPERQRVPASQCARRKAAERRLRTYADWLISTVVPTLDLAVLRPLRDGSRMNFRGFGSVGPMPRPRPELTFATTELPDVDFAATHLAPLITEYVDQQSLRTLSQK
jgi:hypothetical protein